MVDTNMAAIKVVVTKFSQTPIWKSAYLTQWSHSWSTQCHSVWESWVTVIPATLLVTQLSENQIKLWNSWGLLLFISESASSRVAYHWFLCSVFWRLMQCYVMTCDHFIQWLMWSETSLEASHVTRPSIRAKRRRLRKNVVVIVWNLVIVLEYF